MPAMKRVDKRIESARKLIKRGCVNSDKQELRDAIAILDELYLDIVFGNKLTRRRIRTIGWLGKITSGIREATCAFYGINPHNLEPNLSELQHEKTARIKTLLFLRPLRSSRRFLLPDLTGRIGNRLYAGRQSFSAVTIAYWSLETLLHASTYNCWAGIATGGVYEVFGMGRCFQPDWKQQMNAVIDMSERILFLPEVSDGICWEIQAIIKKHKVDKMEIIMLPSSLKSVCALDIDPFNSGDFNNMEQMWDNCRQRYKTFGLDLPEYSSEGAFIRFGSDGKPVSQLPFGKLLRGEWQ
jgi:hypothetical protein